MARARLDGPCLRRVRRFRMILNRQRDVRVSLRRLEEFYRRARRELRLSKGSLTICLVTDTEIARWNRAYRGKNRPTDVLSFPSSGELERKARQDRGRGGSTLKRKRRRRDSAPFFAKASAAYLGDIAIAPSVARRNARRLGRSVEDEMRILVLHGMLHLMGYDHETDAGQMDRREERLRRKLGLA
ncbi:MAG TPA: rRNA maturation RNase YbeY [Candidatus Acidoferrales bacterium]|nr:rRNA maturation RNase YbeY [Candidatus Acidoferrales bacterium]